MLYRLGSLRKTDAREYVKVSDHSKVWITNASVNILGVWVDNDPNKIQELNYEPIFTKVVETLKSWKNRNLSLIGRINIVNTLCGSLFVYKMLVLPNMEEHFVQKIEKCFLDYIWKGGVPKIAKAILQGNKEDGGLGLVNLRVKEKSLKISWIMYMQYDVEIAQLTYHAINMDLREIIWKCNLLASDVKSLCKGVIAEQYDNFWVQTLRAWCEINFVENVQNAKKEIIWFNSHIRIGGWPMFLKNSFLKGLVTIGQLYENDRLISCRKAADMFDLKLMEYNGLISAMPAGWRRSANDSNESECLHERLKENPQVVRTAYKMLNQNSSLITEKIKKWERELNMDISYDKFITCFEDVYRVTNIVKYCSFQYTLLQRALTTNIQLCRYGIVSSELCYYCETEKETALHLLIQCRVVGEFWIKVENFMLDFGDEPIHFNIDTVLCNRLVDDSRHIKNFLCLVAKQFIYRCKCQKKKLCIFAFKRLVFKLKASEKYIAITNGKLRKYCKKWNEEYPEVQDSNVAADNNMTDNFVQEYINDISIQL